MNYLSRWSHYVLLALETGALPGERGERRQRAFERKLAPQIQRGSAVPVRI
jgi:hypothetical protein